jgi:hypothetical protein
MRSHRQSRTRLIFTLLALTVALLAIAACGGEATPAPMATGAHSRSARRRGAGC